MRRRAVFNPRALREARGSRSLSEIAAAVGVTRWTVSHWERAGSQPRADDLKRISEVTKKPLDFFFTKSRRKRGAA